MPFLVNPDCRKSQLPAPGGKVTITNFCVSETTGKPGDCGTWGPQPGNMDHFLQANNNLPSTQEKSVFKTQHRLTQQPANRNYAGVGRQPKTSWASYSTHSRPDVAGDGTYLFPSSQSPTDSTLGSHLPQVPAQEPPGILDDLGQAFPVGGPPRTASHMEHLSSGRSS